MDTRIIDSHSHKASDRKRVQKFQHFALTPEDEKLLEELPPYQQAILRSTGSYQERAEQLGVAVGTVRSRLHRARAALEKLRQRHQAPEQQSDEPFEPMN